MVLDVTLERIKFNPEPEYDAFTIHVGSHRILTVEAYSDTTVTKWLKHVLKRRSSKTAGPTKRSSDAATIYVGLVAESEEVKYTSKGLKDVPYDVLAISVGSHTMVYNLPYPDPPERLVPRFVNAFFANPRVVVLGTDMANVAAKLKRLHGVEIRNAVDLNELSVKKLRRHDLDLARYDLDCLAKVVLGKQVDVDRPEEKLEWDSLAKLKFFTVDSYLCFWVGAELFKAVDGGAGAGVGIRPGGARSAKKKNKKMMK